MKKPILVSAALLAAAMQLTSCSDRMAVSPAILDVTPRHHERLIEDCTIYIKYGTSDKPEVFDDSAKCEMTGGVPVAHFQYLKTGVYYVFGQGFDPQAGEDVQGGAPVKIHVNGKFTYNLAVSESGHN